MHTIPRFAVGVCRCDRIRWAGKILQSGWNRAHRTTSFCPRNALVSQPVPVIVPGPVTCIFPSCPFGPIHYFFYDVMEWTSTFEGRFITLSTPRNVIGFFVRHGFLSRTRGCVQALLKPTFDVVAYETHADRADCARCEKGRPSCVRGAVRRISVRLRSECAAWARFRPTASSFSAAFRFKRDQGTRCFEQGCRVRAGYARPGDVNVRG
jgi:hypothetical protein